jgi:cytidine deaminase
MKKEEILNLIKKAGEARKHAYAPYSDYKVGACVVTEKGEVFSGCNVENASLGGTVCAERVAIYKAVSEGHKTFKAIVIMSKEKKAGEKGAPCGICRQVIYEFAPQAEVITSDPTENYQSFTIGEILPFAFGPKNLNIS